MPFEWTDYLTFATDLDNNRNNEDLRCLTCPQEAIDRCIVSRAYYAAFHHSKKHAEQKLGYKFPDSDIHHDVRIWFLTNRLNRNNLSFKFQGYNVI